MAGLEHNFEYVKSTFWDLLEVVPTKRSVHRQEAIMEQTSAKPSIITRTKRKRGAPAVVNIPQGVTKLLLLVKTRDKALRRYSKEN